MAARTAQHGGRRGPQSAQDKLLTPSDRPPRRWPRRMLIGANVVVLMLLALGASTYGYVQWRLGEVTRIKVPGLHQVTSGPLTILAVGSDTRNLGKGASANFGNDQTVQGQRSDTIMLVRVVPATSSVALLSIPRDLLVPVPGLGTTRINAAFNSGPALLVKTIQQDLGIQINHYVVVDFYTFTQIADSIGGVYQYFPAPARDLYSNLSIPKAGCVLLKGAQALAFVRSREYQYYEDGSWQYQLVPESDLARIQRQQDFVKLSIKKAEQVINPLTLNSVFAGVASSLTVDSTFSNSLMLSLARALRHTDASAIPEWTYPTVNSPEVPGALGPVPSEDQAMVQQFLSYGLPARAATATATPTTAPSLKPSSIAVRVLNGSGTPGQAAQAASALRAQGFSVSSTGDASAFDYTSNVVQYGPQGLTAAKVLQASVGGTTQLVEVPSLTGNNLVLVTGSSYAAGTPASPPGTASPPTSASPTTSVSPTTSAPTTVETDSSSFFHGEYVPPGLQPGQVPEKCPS